MTDDAGVAARARRLRFHGSDDRRTFVDVGYNSRLDSMQAAVLRVFLRELDAWNERRRAVAHAYAEIGLGAWATLPAPTPGAEHVYHLYVVRHPRADYQQAALGRAGIESAAYYRRPVHRQPAMAPYAPPDLDLPGTDAAARAHLALPMGPDLSRAAVEEVVRACASGST